MTLSGVVTFLYVETRAGDLTAESHVDAAVVNVEAAVGRVSRKTGDAITGVGARTRLAAEPA